MQSLHRVSDIYRMGRTPSGWERIGARANVGGRYRFPDGAVFARPGYGVGVRDGWHRGVAAHQPLRHAGYVTWIRPDCGLPQSQGWFTGKRQTMSTDTHQPAELYFGTTNGEIWASRNEDDKWTCIARHLPHIYVMGTVEPA